MRNFIGLTLLIFLAHPTYAEVADLAADHFAVSHEAELTAPPARAWTALVDEIGQWWDASHTFGGDSGALRIEAKPQGCFCESLPDGGGVVHLTVINVIPQQAFVLSGGLGPLQQHPVTGVMTWQFEPADTKTRVTMTYRVSGWVQGSSFRDLAPVVDRVLGEQLDRYSNHVNK